jgi:mono/diheme cytochrome c family protein
MSRPRIIPPALAAILLWGLLAAAARCGDLTPSVGRPADIDFDRDIQPLLARCVQCHGPGTAEAGLRLDERESASVVLESGHRAVVPGDTAGSALLDRVSAADPAERMPPTGAALSADQVELLRRWIASGADWPAHWAYRPLAQPELPTSAPPGHDDWPITPIDHFILARLAERGLTPSPAADRRALLRRLSLDLIGLPPTPEELAAFQGDDAPGAYERQVDRLLDSPHYGERWARHWMDVVHYAETHGNDQDRPRPNAWPYRDWLIRALNADMPYQRFVAEQVAGDVLFPGDPRAIEATGFLATGPWDESSLRDIHEDAIDREIARYLDRDDIVTTVMSTFASSTVHCARCHDHKFDPISQRDYYALQAVFAATDKGERPYDPDPAVGLRRQQLLAERARLPALREALDPSLLEPELHARISDWEQSLAAGALTWVVLDPAEATSAAGTTLAKQEDLSLLASGERPEKDTYTITARTTLSGISGIRLELLTDPSLPHNGPGRQDNGNLHLNEFRVTVAPAADEAAPTSDKAAPTADKAAPTAEKAAPMADKAAPVEPIRLSLENPQADFNQAGWEVAKAIDDSPGTAWGIHPEVGKPHVGVFEVRDYPAIDGEVTLTFTLEQTHGSSHLIGRPRLSVTTMPRPLPLQLDALPAEIATIVNLPPAQRTDPQRASLAAYYLDRQFERQLAALPPEQFVYVGSNKFKPDGSFRPSPVPRTVHVLARGNIATPGDEALPGALSCVPGLPGQFNLTDPNDEGARRAALARWLIDPSNVLTWRSIVNRVWHYHFGRGISDTPNDFGRMGAAPTHPELLDWLAAWFRDGGGSLKQLHRLIVTSAVYRQSSAHVPAHAEIDGDNRLLWRMNRARLDAESIRDAALRITGLLDPTMGGPSVKQFIQTPGVHVTPTVDYLGFDPDDPANYRRSVYRFVFRTLPDPFMDSLDCADASQLTPARNTSVTALQALSMLNNRFMVRQSEHLAARLATLSPDPAGQIAALYRLALLREPTTEESAEFTAYAARHGLANACRVLLNSNEFMFVD